MSKKIPKDVFPKVQHLIGRLRGVPRFLYKACGFTDIELDRPIIAIANSYEEAGPGHIHLRQIGDAVKAGVRIAGGTPVEFNVIGPCSAFGSDFRYDLPQRDAIADSIEIQILGGLQCDGLVCICTCDKSVPGMWMGAARLDLPTIFITGGSASPGTVRGETVCFPASSDVLYEYMNKLSRNEITVEGFNEFFIDLEDNWLSSCGACPMLTTAETTQILTEALGLALPFSSLASGPEKLRFAKMTGMKIMDVVKEKLKFSRIVNEKSMINSIKVLNAIGGGTNAVVHLLALAYTLRESKINLDLFDRVCKETPFLCAIEPNGPFSTVDFEKSGGVPFLMNEIKNLLDLEVKTVTGNTLGENLENVSFKNFQINREVISSIDKPFSTTGAIKVLRGNLAPLGAVTRLSEKYKEKYNTFKGPAKCFNTSQSAMAAIISGKINSGDTIIVRYQGPRAAAMNEILDVVIAINLAGGLEDVIIVSDGRFSGASFGLICIGHVAPEAYVGGPLALIENDDIIEIDFINNQLNVVLSDDEIAERIKSWKRPRIKRKKGVLAIWEQIALQADKGAVLKTFL